MRDRWELGGAKSLALLFVLCLPVRVLAVGGEPAPAPVAPRSAEAEYNQGLRAKAAKRFAEAIGSFRRSVDLRPTYPEAWNELGFALRQTGQHGEALKAYDQALRLRPNYPEALEYLGEAYVKLGRLDDARAILARLKSLDAGHARELEEAIQTAK
jgi:Flp pilus assembly protein TadD